MRVLVASASRHGATAEIAEAIGATLASLGIDVETTRVEDVDGVDAYDAVVLGSAVYMGRWMEPARRFLDVHGDALTERPTWLFSSGPVGSPPIPDAARAVDLGDALAMTGAREHRLFPGRLDRARLGRVERTVARALRAPEGDDRPWDDITAWATAIGARLLAEARGTMTPPHDERTST